MSRALASWLALALAACQSAAIAGTTCERASDCGAPLVCRFGRCRAECADQRDCPSPALCLLDTDGVGSCSLPVDPDCSAMPGSCPSPLACVGARCVNLCADVTVCPSGSTCVSTGDGRDECARADADAGVAPIDADRADAAQRDSETDARSQSVDAFVAPDSSTWPPLPVATLMVSGDFSIGPYSALSADGSFALIGDPGNATHDVNGGIVRAFARSGLVWSFDEELFGDDALAAAQLGRTIALSADGLRAVAATYGSPRSVYVLVRTGAAWTQEASLDPVGSATFGDTLAISVDGATIVVGADTGALHPGVVGVYVRSGSSWAPPIQFQADVPRTDDGFGSAVALTANGGQVLVGCPRCGAAGSSEGAASVIVFPSGVATPLIPGDAAPMQNFGAEVAIAADGSRAFVMSAPAGVGRIHVFAGSTWAEEATLVAPAGMSIQPHAGERLPASADGSRVLVAVVTETPAASYVLPFTRAGTTWTMGSAIGPAGAGFISLAADGHTALVGDGPSNGVTYYAL